MVIYFLKKKIFELMILSVVNSWEYFSLPVVVGALIPGVGDGVCVVVCVVVFAVVFAVAGGVAVAAVVVAENVVLRTVADAFVDIHL